MRLHEEVCPEIYYRALPHTYATGCAVKAPCTVKRTGSSRMRICPGFTDGDILPPTSFSASARLSSSASEPHTCAASHVQVRREWSVGPAPRAGHRELRRLQEATEGAKAATGGYGKLWRWPRYPRDAQVSSRAPPRARVCNGVVGARQALAP